MKKLQRNFHADLIICNFGLEYDNFIATIMSLKFAKGNTLTLLRGPLKQAVPLMLYTLISKGPLDPRFPVVRQNWYPLKVHYVS